MKQEIKQRIDRMNFGEVPEGYKKTKIGIIPQDWEVKKLKDIGYSTIGLTYSPDNIVSSGGTLVLRSSNIQNNKIQFEDNVYVKMTIKENLITKQGDILICARNGSLSLIGKSAYIDEKYCGHSFGAFMCVFRCKNHKYIFQFFQSVLFKRQTEINLGSQINQLISNDLAHFKLPLPPLPEQEKIAEILATWDKAIELKEQYIITLETRKKWLMQKLLTGTVRLPGFKGNWQKLYSKNIFKNISDKNHDGLLDVLSVTQGNGVVKRDEVGIDIKYNKDSLHSYKKVTRGQFIISLRSFQGGIEFSELEGIVSPAYTILTNCMPICDYYYKYYFKTTTFISKLNSLIYGIRDGKQIGYSDFSTLRIDYPPLPEQIAIANILSLADLEISMQKAGLETLKLQKKGLMQVLLTGKVRTVGN